MQDSFILKGHICYTPKLGSLTVRENAFIVCENGICRGVFDRIPDVFSGFQVIDCSGMLILPGLIDLHIHAAQYPYIGNGMDYELLDWLNQKAFPEEARFASQEYAKKAYSIFADNLRKGATTRMVVFATIHPESTLILMDLLEASGLISYVGKVNMDRDSPADLLEKSADFSAAETRRFIREWKKRGYLRTMPIITPRFIPSCTDSLMAALGEIRKEYHLPVQSHLSENYDEIELVRKLCPDAAFYGDAYDRYDLFGREANTVMAHCVHSSAEEEARIKKNGVFIAHCPSSNINLGSGIAPVRRYIKNGIRIGLGTDVAGGSSDSMFRAVTDAIQVSKLYWRLIDQTAMPLSFRESLYLATKGGGAFFGKVGSFEDGYAFDALVLDDNENSFAHPLSVCDRLERAFYLELDRNGIVMKFAGGRQIL